MSQPTIFQPRYLSTSFSAFIQRHPLTRPQLHHLFTPSLIHFCNNLSMFLWLDLPISSAGRFVLPSFLAGWLAVGLAVGLSVCLAVWLSVCPSVRPSVRRSVGLSVCRSVGLSVCLSVCLFLWGQLNPKLPHIHPHLMTKSGSQTSNMASRQAFYLTCSRLQIGSANSRGARPLRAWGPGFGALQTAHHGAGGELARPRSS